MNLGTLRTWTANFCGDPNQSRFSAQYLAAINEAQKQFALDTKSLYKDQSYSIVDGTATYALPSDFMFEKAGGITLNGLGLIPKTRAELNFYYSGTDWDDLTGTPLFYIVDPENARNTIRMVPIPQGADVGTNNLVMTYYPNPADLAADSDTPLNSTANLAQFHIGIAAYAAWLILNGETPTPELMAKMDKLLAQYSDKSSEAISLYGNTVSASLRMRGGRYWRS